MNASKIISSLGLIAFNLLFAGCAIPQQAQMEELGRQTFGTDAYLKVVWVHYSGPLSNAVGSALGNTSDELAVGDAMRSGQSQKTDVLIWSESSSKAASTLLRALRYPGLQKGLPQLRLLFVGDAQDAERVRLAVEATGAKFFFHQM